MSPISNIDDRSLNLVPILNNDKLQRVQTAEREIIRVDKEIGARSQQVNNIKNLIKARENYIASNNELISLYKESRELDRKRMSLMEQQIKLLQESKETLQNTNNKLQDLLDRGQGRRTVSAEPRLQKRSIELNDLDRKLTSLSKQEAVIKEQTTLVDVKTEKLFMKVDYTEKEVAKLEAKVNNIGVTNPQEKSSSQRDTSEFSSGYKSLSSDGLNNYTEDEFIKNVRILGQSLVYQDKRQNEKINIWNTDAENIDPAIKTTKKYQQLNELDKNLRNSLSQNVSELYKNQQLLANYKSDTFGSKAGSSQEEDAIARIIERSTILHKLNDQIFIQKEAINNMYEDLRQNKDNKEAILLRADELLKASQCEKAINEYDKILNNRLDYQTVIDSDYRPLDEQLRQASKLYMSFYKKFDISELSASTKDNLIASYIAAHTEGKYHVSKNEALDMIKNDFFYSVAESTLANNGS